MISSILNEIISLLFSLLEYSITVLWNLTVKYGLNPYYSYSQFIKPNSSFISFYNLLFNNIYSNITVTVIIFSSLYILIKNSFFVPVKFSNIIIKFFIALIIFYNSYDLGILFLKFSYVFYNYIYKLNGNWYNILNANPVISSKIISLFFVSSFVMAISILFGVLIFRQALIVFFVIVFPLISIFLIVPDTEKYVFKFIRIFFELSFFPFFTLIMLYTLTIFSYDPFLQIGIIYVAAIAPVYFMTEVFNLFRMGIFGMVSGFDMPSIAFSPESLLNSGSSISGMISEPESYYDPQKF